ncbi:hypothetical protein HK099_007603 [Clydaea vesicula]|uniref:Uncharacterized protein n=1 Tax=Clydaea vesicula TaxID=447962 RepID=A0AAD5Y261_9FUNG|nr:hypothetical protein HK099_007603 [Clydaea vesicula]
MIASNQQSCPMTQPSPHSSGVPANEAEESNGSQAEQSRNAEAAVASPPPTSTAANRSNLNSVATIFQVQQWKLLPSEKIPILNEAKPLSLFFHADKKLTTEVKNLKKLKDPATRQFSKQNEKVHKQQKLLLDTINIIYQEMDESLRSSRGYRAQLPPEDQRELEEGFSENILFAAQALTRGFRIRGIENFTHDLLEPARTLCASIEALRMVFRKYSLEPNSFRTHEKLYPVLKDFDASWTKFEQKICFCYFQVTYHGRPGKQDETDMFLVLMSETILRAVSENLVTLENMQNFDPQLMFAIPRLTIVSALVHMPDCINITDREVGFRWFRQKSELLQNLKANLNTFSKEELQELEKLLANNEDCTNNFEFKENKEDLFKKCYKNICLVADDLQSGPRAKEFVSILQKAFSMH